MEEKDNKLNVKLFTIIAYIGPLFLVGKFSVEKDNELVKFHCTQGGVLFIFEVLLSLIVVLLNWLLSFNEALREIITLLVSIGVCVFAFIMILMGIYFAIKNKLTALPFLGDIVIKFNKLNNKK